MTKKEGIPIVAEYGSIIEGVGQTKLGTSGFVVREPKGDKWIDGDSYDELYCIIKEYDHAVEFLEKSVQVIRMEDKAFLNYAPLSDYKRKRLVKEYLQ